MYKALTVSTFICVFILALSGSGSIATAQSTLTPNPTITPTLPSGIPSSLPVITAANANQLKPIAVLSPGEVYGAAWSPDGKMLAVYGRKGVWLYTLNDLRSPRFLEPDLDRIEVAFGSATFSPDGKYLAAEVPVGSAFELGGVQLWNIATGNGVFLPNVTSPAFIADSSILLVQDRDYGAPRLLFWDIEYPTEYAPRGKYRLSLPDVYLTVTSPNGEVIACAETRQNSSIVSLRNAKTGQLIRVLDNRSQTISKMMFDPSGKLLAAVGKYGLMKVWNIATGELRYILGRDVSNWEDHDYIEFYIAFSFDGTLVSLVAIPVGHQALAEIWSVATGKPLGVFVTDYSSWIYFTNTTMIVIDDNRSRTTHVRGAISDTDSEPLSYATHPIFNPVRTIIASFNYEDGITLYAVS